MTARFWPGLVVLLALMLAPRPSPAAEAPEFRGLAFGSRLEALPAMEPVAAFGEVAYFRRSDEKPLLGEDCPTDIRYGFSRGALFSVRLTLAGCSGLADLIRAYEAKYGKPARESAPGTLRLLWRGPALTVSLSHFAREGRIEVDYVYLPELSHDEREIYQTPEAIRAEGPVGFRGLRFGRDISTTPNMVPAYREGAVAYFRRRDERMDLGATKLSDVLYGFYRNRFFAVLMRAASAEDFEPLRRAYMAKYGQPRAIAATLEEDLVWSWPKAQITLSRDAADGDLAIRYADAGLLAEVAAAETAAGAPPVLSGGSRLFSRGEPPRSFRGAAFGSPERALPSGEYLYVHRGRRYYRRTDERLNLGDIPLQSVLYAYDDGRLASVTLTVAPHEADPEKDFERVLSAYNAKYGPPSKRPDNEGGDLYLWAWPGLSIALVRPRAGPLEVHYVDASLLRRRESQLATKALDALDQKIFETPKADAPRIERPTGQE